MRSVLALLICVALAGCSVRMYGNQSTSGGATATSTASHVGGSAKFSGGRVAFSSGQVPPRGASGGHLRLSGDAAAVLLVGVVIADFLNAIRGDFAPKPLPPETRIGESCSCYQKPVNGEQ